MMNSLHENKKKSKFKKLDLRRVVQTTSAKPVGSGGDRYWLGHCPAPGHKDKKASLTIFGETDDAKVECKAGCPFETVRDALLARNCGIMDTGEINILPARDSAQKPVITDQYDYRDEEGNLLYQVLRYTPKDFRQRRPDGAGGWIWNLKDVRRVLYRLPELIQADKKTPIIWPEGEKDCGNLGRLGFTATTTAQGVNGFKAVADHAREVLAGGKIILLPDNDAPGREYILTVARALHGVAEGIWVVDLPGLPPKGDVSDWIEARRAEGMDDAAIAKALRDIVNKTPPWQPTGADTALSGSAETAQAMEWEDPVLFDEFPVPEINTHWFPGWMADYIESVAQNVQVPRDVPAMLALSVLATALQGKFKVMVKPDYYEPCCLWAMVIMPPSSRKTGIFTAMLPPLTEWEKSEYERLRPAIEQNETDRATAAARIKHLERLASKTDDPDELDAIKEKINRLKENMPPEIYAPRLFTGESTPEALAMLLQKYGRFSFLADEGGFFAVMAGLYSDGKSNINPFLQGHANSPIRSDRVGKSITVDDPYLTFGVTVQNEIIKETNQGSQKRFRGLGALARFLFAVPPPKIDLDDEEDHPIPEFIKETYARQVAELLNIPVPDDGPKVLTLSPEAQESWKKFAKQVAGERLPGGCLDEITDWAGKLAGAAARIAGLFHVAEYGEGILTIGNQTMENALDLAQKFLIPHALKAFGMMAQIPEIENAKHVLKWIQTNGKATFTQRECHRSVHARIPTADQVRETLNELVQRNVINGPQTPKTGGRQPDIYSVNPKVLGGKRYAS